MSKFTPATWAVVGKRSIMSADGGLVADCMFPNRDANARLIAAAPELLAVLESIATADPRKWDEGVRDQFQQWAQNRARWIIAKATGEAP